MEQEELKKQLLYTIHSGLSGKAIVKHAKISYDILSKFKNGWLLLCENDANKLKTYLDKVVIDPQ